MWNSEHEVHEKLTLQVFCMSADSRMKLFVLANKGVWVCASMIFDVDATGPGLPSCHVGANVVQRDAICVACDRQASQKTHLEVQVQVGLWPNEDDPMFGSKGKWSERSCGNWHVTSKHVRNPAMKLGMHR